MINIKETFLQILIFHEKNAFEPVFCSLFSRGKKGFFRVLSNFTLTIAIFFKTTTLLELKYGYFLLMQFFRNMPSLRAISDLPGVEIDLAGIEVVVL